MGLRTHAEARHTSIGAAAAHQGWEYVRFELQAIREFLARLARIA